MGAGAGTLMGNLARRSFGKPALLVGEASENARDMILHADATLSSLRALEIIQWRARFRPNCLAVQLTSNFVSTQMRRS